MSTPIVRLFAHEARARAAISALREERFAQADITLLLPGQAPSADAANSLDSLVSAVLGGAVARPGVEVIADAIRAGQALVVVRAAWGLAGLAIRVLDAQGPTANPLPQPPPSIVAWEDAAPLSSSLRVPTLLRGSPMPLSNLFGIENLAPSRPLIGGLRSHRLAIFGEPHLSRKPSPLSSLFALPTLTRSGRALLGGLTRSDFFLFGSPRLSANPNPLSSMLGWPPLKSKRGDASGRRLWDEASPLSSALGLPVLVRPIQLFGSRSRRPENLAASRPWFGTLVPHQFALFGQPKPRRSPAPLSSLFGLPTLTSSGRAFFGGLTRSDFYLFGKPNLSRNSSPLSSLFGLGTLAKP